MSNREAALRSGLGTLIEVCDTLRNLPDEDMRLSENILQVCRLLMCISNSVGGNAIVTALFCSQQNEKFNETGLLWRTNEDGNPSREFIADKSGRSAIASLIS